MGFLRLATCLLSVFLLVALFGLSVDSVPSPQGGEYDQANSKDICSLPMKVGFCKARMPRYMYDPQLQDCVQFYYGGCSGNANNFSTKDKCLQICGGV